jgi:hypothetical protein
MSQAAKKIVSKTSLHPMLLSDYQTKLLTNTLLPDFYTSFLLW